MWLQIIDVAKNDVLFSVMCDAHVIKAQLLFEFRERAFITEGCPLLRDYYTKCLFQFKKVNEAKIKIGELCKYSTRHYRNWGALAIRSTLCTTVHLSNYSAYPNTACTLNASHLIASHITYPHWGMGEVRGHQN